MGYLCTGDLVFPGSNVSIGSSLEVFSYLSGLLLQRMARAKRLRSSAADSRLCDELRRLSLSLTGADVFPYGSARTSLNR